MAEARFGHRDDKKTNKGYKKHQKTTGSDSRGLQATKRPIKTTKTSFQSSICPRVLNSGNRIPPNIAVVEHKGLPDAVVCFVWCKSLILRLLNRPARWAVCPTSVGRVKNAGVATGTGLLIPLPERHPLKKRTVRLREELDSRVEEAASRLGFRTGSDFIRHALESALNGADRKPPPSTKRSSA